MKKNYAVSYIRLISTCLIVFLHITQRVNSIFAVHIAQEWANLGLVMFFCLSAFLYSQRNIEKGKTGRWLLHRYIELAVPGVLVSIGTVFVWRIARGPLPVSVTVSAILSGLGMNIFVPHPWLFIQLWFITYILLCYATVPFIQKIPFDKMSFVKFWGLLVGATVLFQGFGAILSLGFGIHLFSFGVLLRFYLSYSIYRRYGIETASCKKTICFISVCSVALIAVTSYVRYCLPPSFDPFISGARELLFIYTQTLAGTALFYWLYRLFSRVKPRVRLLNLSDRYSYPVYLTHCLFIGYSTSVIGRFSNLWVGIAAALGCTAVASVIVYAVSLPVKKAIYGLLSRQ